LTNVGQTTFGKAKDEEMVRDTVGEEDAISEEARCNQHSVFSQTQTFETQRNGGSGGGEGLPRINADERGLNNGATQIEWRPTPDMYRTDTPEGREAYEACLRRTMAPRVGEERRPPQPAIARAEAD